MPDIFTRFFPSSAGSNPSAIEESLMYEWAEYNLPVAQDLLVLLNQMRDAGSRGSAV